MSKAPLGWLSSAHLIALAALFVALGGTAYSALKITSADVANRSLAGKDLRKNTVGGKEVNEGKLGDVLRCPDTTAEYIGLCFETAERPAMTFLAAETICNIAGRRLPTVGELSHFSDLVPNISWSDYELTSTAFNDDANGDRVYVAADSGNDITNVSWVTAKAYRCVVPPS